MTQQIINVGTGPDSYTGESLRTAFQKVNDNFSQLYAGNVGANISGNIITANGFVTSGNVVAGNVTVAGNISAYYFTGDGSQLTGITVSANTGNIAFSNLTISGNIAGNIVLDPAGDGNVSIVSDVIPGANVTYNLGSSTRQWKDLWLSNSTLYLGGFPVTVSNTGVLSVNGSPVSSSYGNANVTVFLPTYSGLLGGTLSTVSQPNITAVGILTSLTATNDITVNSGRFIGNGSGLTAITGANVNGTVANATYAVTTQFVTGLTGANVTTALGYVPLNSNSANTYSNTNVASYLPTYTGNIAGNIVKNGYSWIFGTTGNTTFPNGATFTGYDLYASANSYIELAGYSGNTYVGVDNNSAFIQTDWNGSQKQWDFLANGLMTAPGAFTAVGNITGGNISTGVITLTNGAVIKDNAGDSVAFGQSAGTTSQGNSAVAIGHNAGVTSQGTFTVAIGRNAGQTSQGGGAVAVGVSAGDGSQGAQAVAVGNGAGGGNQGNSAVAIGISAGQSTQGNSAVAIGDSAGYTNQGVQAIAIGRFAGVTNQANNSIILNATGSDLNQTTANTFTVAPVRNDVSTANVAQVMFYNTTSKEITYGNTISVAGNITGVYILGNGSQLTGLPATYGNANVATFLAAYGSNTISTTGNITGGNISATNHTGTTVSVTGNITAANFFGNGNTLSNVATRFESSWTVPTGNSTQSFTVAASETYYLWVDCNIPNGILVWNATATVTNTNVPVVGAQYAWVYNGGGSPVDFTSIPDQFIGTANTIVRSNVAPSSTTNRFDFGINNTSGGNITVRYGWVAIS